MLTILDYFHGKGIPLLDKGMPSCPDDYLKGLLGNSDLVVQCFTLTLMPKWHGTDAKKMYSKIKNHIRDLFSRNKQPYYLELHFEYTLNGILHGHLYQVGTKYLCSRLVTSWRSTFGNTKPSKCFNLQGWIGYITKEDVFPVFKFFIINKKYCVTAEGRIAPTAVSREPKAPIFPTGYVMENKNI